VISLLFEAENIHKTVGKMFSVAFLVSAVLVLVSELVVCTAVEPVSCDKLK